MIELTDAMPPVARRLSLASAAIALADLIIGCTVFAIAALAILAAFGVGWIGLAGEYAAHAMSFGTVAQLRSAAGLVFLCPLFAILVAWLGYRAFQLPRRLWKMALERPTGVPGTVPRPSPMWSGSIPLVPMADGALWAARPHRAAGDFRYVSLQVRRL